MSGGAHRLEEEFIHLGLGATAIVQPGFTGMEWYDGYGERHGVDGAEGRLVSQYDFMESWDSWEMHPVGAEVVICVSGTMVLTQEAPDGIITTVALGPGEYAINPPGTWHIADVTAAPVRAIFITAGEGTVHRPR